MNAERWEQIQEILGVALELEPSERRLFVDAQCGGNPVLHEVVWSYIVAYEDECLLPTLEVEQGIPEEIPNLRGVRLGAYELGDEIGRGGMGEVYKAKRVDGLFEKEVAVKILSGGVSGTFSADRFAEERRILARMEHENIVRLIDGGTTPDGIPYLVMDYIDGLHIDQYCKTHKLEIKQRVLLFLKVCKAVAGAHGRAVIHGDIKPANILVTTKGEPK